MKKWFKLFYNSLYEVEFQKKVGNVVGIITSTLTGALIAFLFTNYIFAGVVAICCLFFPLLIYICLLMHNESKLNILYLMNISYKEKRYFDVLKYGYTNLELLRDSNRYDICIQVDIKVLETINILLDKQERNYKKEYLINLNGSDKSLILIQCETLIDLGWCYYKANENIDLSKNKIILGINNAIDFIIEKDLSKELEIVKPLIKVAMKGFRHLAAVLSEDKKNQKKIDNMVLDIFSQGNITDYENWEGLKAESIDEWKHFTQNSIKDKVYSAIKTNYLSDNAKLKNTTRQYLVFDLLPEKRVKEIQNIVSKVHNLDEACFISMLVEQSYAWSRRISKELNKAYNSFSLEYDKILAIGRAMAFTQFYTTEKHHNLNINFDCDISETFSSLLNDFENQTNKKRNINTRDMLKLLGLLCEIIEMDLYSYVKINESPPEFLLMNGSNEKCRKSIALCESFCDICYGKRADLFIRHSYTLMQNYLVEYNMNTRFNLTIPYSQKQIMLREIRNKIKQLKIKISHYERYKDTQNNYLYKDVLYKLKKYKKECHKRFLIKKNCHYKFEIMHKSGVTNNIKVTQSEIKKVQKKWVKLTG